MVTDRKERLDLSVLNENVRRDPEKAVAYWEKHYRDQVEAVAEDFVSHMGESRVLLLAGPSSSGKTTTSLNLMEALHRRGIRTIPVSLDDFFLGPGAAPLLEDGTRDLESVELLDAELLDRCFRELFETGRCDFPIFDFENGSRSEKVNHFAVDDRTAVVVEGLHALNPFIAGREFCKKALKVYISIKTEYYLDDERILSTRQLRLIRRIIRDSNYRACPPEVTLSMWKNVVRGEDHYIRPFRLSADYWVDSFHGYEAMVYRPLLLSLLDRPEVRMCPQRETAATLRDAVRCFEELPLLFVPEDSLLREFLVLP